MKTYEVIYEVFNNCSNNQMRDIFFEELDFTGDEALEPYVRNKHNNTIEDIDITPLEEGALRFDFVVGGVRQRYTFTPIG